MDDIQEIEIDWQDLVLMPEGVYEGVYVSHEAISGSFGAKLKIIFRITELCEFNGKQINGWYNLKELTNLGKKKIVKAARGSKLTTELLNALGQERRKDRLSPAALKGSILKLKVRTVIKNAKQGKLHELQKYSVVDKIVERMPIG